MRKSAVLDPLLGSVGRGKMFFLSFFGEPICKIKLMLLTLRYKTKGKCA